MTQRQVPLLAEDNDANPYNARKNYHQEDGEAAQTADSMYRPPRKPKTEPEVKVTEATLETEDKGAEDNHDYKKRWSDLKKRWDTEVPAFRAALKELDNKEKGEQNIVAPETVDELEKFRKDNPDLFKLATTVAKLEAESQTSGVKQQLDDIENRERQLAKQTAKAEVKKVHPDLDEITQDDGFHDWAESQPRSIQSLIYENPNDSGALIRALDLYKADLRQESTVKENANREESIKADAATLVSTRKSNEPESQKKKIWTRREIAALQRNMDLFDKYESEIDQAIIEGRVVD